MKKAIREKSNMTMDSGNESDHDIIFMDMLANICDGIQFHPNVDRR